MYVSGPYHTWQSGTWANACRMVCTTLEDVQVMVGTRSSASALVRRDVLMYTTWSDRGVREASERYEKYCGGGEERQVVY